jgi:hypothetical protein
MLDTATLRALVTAAHKRGELAVVHVLSEQQARDAIEAGADGLAHMFSGDSVSSDFGQFAVSHHVFVIPTLSTIYLNCGESEGPALLGDPHIAPYIGEAWKRTMAMPKLDPALNHFCKGTDDGMRQLRGYSAGIACRSGFARRRPTKNILATRNIVAVWKPGIRVQRALAADVVWFFGRKCNHFNHNNLHLGEDDGFVAVNKDAVFNVPAHGA